MNNYGTIERALSAESSDPSHAQNYQQYYQRMMAKQNKERAFQINGVALFSMYVVMIMIAGNVLINWVPLKATLYDAGVLAELEPVAREDAITEIYTRGQTMIELSGILSGTLIDFVGPKATFLTGVGIELIGVLCWTFAKLDQKGMWIAGSVLMGISSEACFAGFYSSCFWFPNRIALVSSLINMSKSISFLKSAIIKGIAKYTGFFSMLYVFNGLLVLVLVAGVLFVPFNNSQKVLGPDEAWHEKVLPKNKMSMDSFREIMHLDTWIFLVYVSLTSFRAASFSTFASKFIVNDLPTHAMDIAIPVGGLLSPVFGMIGDKASPLVMCSIINSLMGVIFFLVWGCLNTEGNWRLAMELITVFVFSVTMSFCHGQANLIFQAYYDFDNFGMLSASCAVVLGFFSLCIQPTFSYFNNNPDKIGRMPILMWIISAVGYVLLVLFKKLYFKRKAKDQMD